MGAGGGISNCHSINDTQYVHKKTRREIKLLLRGIPTCD